MNTYPKYKDSGEQWLGQIPAHWEMLACRYILAPKHIVVGKDASKYDLLSLTLNGVVKRDMDNPTGKFPTTFDSYQRVDVGDFIFCMFDNEETPRAVGKSPFLGMITGAYDVMTIWSEKVNSDYLYYYLLDIDNFKKLKPLYRGLRKTVPLDSFRSLKFPIPPIEEQEAMVAYLDEQTAQIDSAIAREQKMIDLLEERKQIIIQHAVTKGLYPNAKMKDSGINDLGVIPECWEVKRLGVLGLFSKGGNISRDNLTEEGECEAILYGDIYTKYTYFAQNIHNHISLQTAKQAVPIYGGDILMAGSGETKEDIGKTIIYQGDQAYAGGDVIIFRQKGINGKYLSSALNSQYAKDYRYRVSKGEIVVHIYPYALKNLYLPIPPVEDQEAIVKYLDKHIANVNCAIDAREKMIALLQERKQIIINEVVTGKIKVL